MQTPALVPKYMPTGAAWAPPARDSPAGIRRHTHVQMWGAVPAHPEQARQPSLGEENEAACLPSHTLRVAGKLGATQLGPR